MLNSISHVPEPKLVGLVVDSNAAARVAIVEALEGLNVMARSVETVDECVRLAEGIDASVAPPVVAIVCSFAQALETQPALLDQIRDRVFAPPIAVTVCPTTEAARACALSRSVTSILMKPIVTSEAMASLAGTVEEGRRRLADRKLVHDFRAQEARLTQGERHVMLAVCCGKLNKQIARELGVSIRTVEQRRRRVFATMDVSSAAPLAERFATVKTLERLHAPRSMPSPNSGVRDANVVAPPVGPTMGTPAMPLTF